MTIVSKTIIGEPTYTTEQISRLQALANMSESEINYNDIPKTTAEDWENATSGYLGTQPLKHKKLDDDVQSWLDKQDNSTLSHINEMIRHVMALRTGVVA